MLTPRTRKSKYYAIKTKVDGITFDSKREAAVYADLKLLERAGKITRPIVHDRAPLMVSDLVNGPTTIGFYEPDFIFYDNEERRTRWIDVKGFDTALSEWKRRHVKAQYGVTVEVWK